MNNILGVLLLGVPVFGSKFVLYVLFILKELYFTILIGKGWFKKNLIWLLVPLFFGVFFRDVLGDFLAIATSLFLGYNLAKRIHLTKRVLLNVSVFLFALHLLSFCSLYLLGYDFLPMTLFGESRHVVPASSPFPFRPSGIFQEPSTLCSVYLTLLVLAKMLDYRKMVFVLVFAAILTFSGISLFSILMLDWRFISKSLKGWIFILIPLSFVVFGFLGPFVINKIQTYSMNLEDYDRVVDLMHLTALDVLIGKQFFEGVVLDNGALVFLFLKFGVLSTPLIVYIFYRAKGCFALILLLFIKISVTLPLIWFVLFYENNRIR